MFRSREKRLLRQVDLMTNPNNYQLAMREFVTTLADAFGRDVKPDQAIPYDEYLNKMIKVRRILHRMVDEPHNPKISPFNQCTPNIIRFIRGSCLPVVEGMIQNAQRKILKEQMKKQEENSRKYKFY